MGDIVVRKVETKADYQMFFEFPWRNYADSPHWVPPLKSARKYLLDREKGAAWQYMEGEYFIAWRGNEPVGIIAGFINHLHNEIWNENIGWFGAFEFIDDGEVCSAVKKLDSLKDEKKGTADVQQPQIRQG